MRRNRGRIGTLLAIFAASGSIVVASAPAADPESGSVSAEAPSVEWTGDVAGEPFTASNLALIADAGGSQGVCPPEPGCSQFDLTVVHPGTSLKVTADGPGALDYVLVEVEDPDGEATVGYEASNHAEVTLANPVA